MSLYRIEVKKYKGMHLLAILCLVVAIQVLFVGTNLGEFKKGQGNPDLIWYQVMQNNAFLKLLLMPTLLATCASIGVQLENRHQMWKMIDSSGHRFSETMKMKTLYLFSRFLLVDFLGWVLIFLLGFVFGVQTAFPTLPFLIYFLSTSLISLAVLEIHLFLSLKWSNQAISLSFAIVGSLFSIILMFISKLGMYVSPYAWYGLLMPLDFEKVGGKFVQVLREPTYYPLVVGLLVACVFYQLVKAMKVGD